MTKKLKCFVILSTEESHHPAEEKNPESKYPDWLYPELFENSGKYPEFVIPVSEEEFLPKILTENLIETVKIGHSLELHCDVKNLSKSEVKLVKL